MHMATQIQASELLEHHFCVSGYVCDVAVRYLKPTMLVLGGICEVWDGI